MAKLVALELDSREARLLVGTTRGQDVVIEKALSVELSDTSGADTTTLADALEKHNIDRGDVLIAVGRSQVELRLLSLPQSPPDEVPEMVRFQAMRQFANIGETWPLDFVPLSDEGGDGQIHVLAAVISPEQVTQTEESCSAANLVPRRMILRPFAAASLLCRQGRAGQGGCQLLISLTSGEAELTVVSDGQVAFLRAVRLPLDDAGNVTAKALVGEVRRTMAAAQNQLSGRPVEKICICQGADEENALRDVLKQDLAIEVEVFDPFDGMRLSKSLQSERPSHPGRFAALIGMLADEARESHAGIDFLHPRRKPPPPSKLRRNLWVATGAGAMAAASLVFVVVTLWSKNSEISDLKAELAANQKGLKVAEQEIQNAGAIDVFSQADITWLDELVWLSKTFPEAEDALVANLTLSSSTKQGGRIDLDGFARTGDTIGRAEAILRDKRHEVQTDGSQEDPRRKGYRHSFRERIVVQKDDAASSRREAPVQAESEATPAAAKTDDSTPPAEAAESSTTDKPSEKKSSADAKTRAVSTRQNPEGEVSSK